MIKIVLLLPLLLHAPSCTGFRVLGVYPVGAHSHNTMFKALMEALAMHGHQVTALSPFPHSTPIANLTDVDLRGVVPPWISVFDYGTVTASWWNPFSLIRLMRDGCGNSLCRSVFESQQFKDMMNGKYGKFDVLITETHGSDCFSAIAHKLKVPLIGMVPLPDVPFMHSRMGSINNPSYIPNPYDSQGGNMNFFERVRNTISTIGLQLLHQRWMVDGSDEVTREFLGADTPPLTELVRNTSLIFVNRHAAMDWPVPVPPNVVHVGGLHVKRAWRGGRDKPLDLDPTLRKWMDDADEHGVIVFTTGSLLKISSLPEYAHDRIFEMLGSLKQRVLFKYEKPRPSAPANVFVTPWVPQGEALAHPKVVLFITHCGLMGTQEAIVAGVPFVCIPMFSDQFHNAALYKHQGIAEVVRHQELHEPQFGETLNKVLSDDRYLMRARTLSARYLDRPRTVEEEAVWWVEYVVRHGGARHLRPLGADLPLHQYLLLDVVGAGLALVLLAALLLRCALRALLRRPPQQRSNNKSKKSQ